MDELLEAAEEAQAYIYKEPIITEEHVEYLEYIEAAIHRVEEMENELDYCKELYDIMEEFGVLVAQDDMSNYLGLSVTMGNLRNLVDKKNEEKPKMLEKFNTQMNKDISALIDEVGTIKDDCLVSRHRYNNLQQPIVRLSARMVIRCRIVPARSKRIPQRPLRTFIGMPETGKPVQKLPETIQSKYPTPLSLRDRGTILIFFRWK